MDSFKCMAIPYLIDLTEMEMVVESGILVFSSEGIPTKLIESQMKIEGFFIELNPRRE